MYWKLFEEWVREIDRKFSAEKRKIALIVDNCPAHPYVQIFDLVELIFLPPNTTSITQTMGQGIIRSTKAKYRSLTVKKLISALDKRSLLPKISVFSVFTMSRKAWNTIPDKTFNNCFKKAGISEEAAERAINDDDDPFNSLDVDDFVKTLDS